MNRSTVYVKAFDEPPVDRREILRYAGVGSELPELHAILEECLAELSGRLRYQLCYRRFPVSFLEKGVDLGFAVTSSETVRWRLCGCQSIVLFGATIGLELDRLIARYSHSAPTKALLLQAIGTERIESLCDAFCQSLSVELAEEGRLCRSRFSPGYGDFPLELQETILEALDGSRRLGVSLTQSMMMTPSKSVTAIVGIADQGGTTSVQENCAVCDQANCAYRRI